MSFFLHLLLMIFWDPSNARPGLIFHVVSITKSTRTESSSKLCWSISWRRKKNKDDSRICFRSFISAITLWSWDNFKFFIFYFNSIYLVRYKDALGAFSQWIIANILYNEVTLLSYSSGNDCRQISELSTCSWIDYNSWFPSTSGNPKTSDEDIGQAASEIESDECKAAYTGINQSPLRIIKFWRL